MKKYLVSLILLVAISVPMLAGAATVAELQAMIAQLQAQLQAQSCVPAGGQVTGPVAPEYATHCCAGLIAQYPNDGRVGSAGVCVRPNSADPVITGISGPTSLAVGQTGTWTAKVTAPANTFIDYNINFGDGSGIASGENRKVSRVNQEISATHSYGTAGTYTITITAANNQQKGGGSPVKATMTVVVGNQPQTGGVPVVTKVRQNTLKAVRNPNNPSSPLIVLTTSAVIKATGGDVYVADLGTHLDSLSPFGGMPSYPNFNLTSTAEPTGKMLYYVRNGEEATFTKTLSYDSNQMFAGSYQGFFDRIIFSPTSDYDNVRPRSLALSNPIVAPYATNVLPVVGEQGPYIKSVTLSTAMPNVFEIRGTRLLKTSSVNIDGVSWSFFGPAAGGKQTDSTIYILNNPPLSAGSHSVYVESPTLGRSNTVTLQVGTPTPSLGVSASNALITQGAVIRDSSQNPIGQNFNINFTLVNNGSADVFVNTSGMMDIDMSGSIDGSGASTNTNTPSISPSSLSGDTSSAYIIPAGASRSFYFTASMRNDGTTLGNVNYRITGINYGPASNNTTGYKITTGLAGLSMSGAFYPGNASIKSITLTSPTSGERVLTGVDYNIRWNSATPGTNSNAKIQLSYVMNDSTYPAGRTITDDIDAVAPNMGVYQWRVPEFYQFGVDPNRFQIKVSSGSVSGTSQYFTIAHGRSTANLSVTAVAPFPARVGDQVRVGWSPYNQNDEYMLSLLKKNDDNFVRWLNLGPSNGSEKTFAVPNVPAGDYYVRVTTGNGRQNNGYSNGFTVTGATQNKTVSFTAQTGGNLTAGRSVVVSWTSTGFITPSETGRMYLYNNNGSMVANPYQNYLDKGQVVDGWNLYLAGGSFAPTLRRDLANGVYQFVMKTLGDQE
ncbi:MAG: PKD domain-containing protein, partial [Candidatus Vogelbacteria bacterium]|nr:PKD domain-containing protein [Candidatus Vogelbacteria bacterium]